MTRVLLRLGRDLLLLPLTALLVYTLVAHIPMRRDTESKTEAIASVERQMREDLGVGQPWGFLRPWEKLLSGERLGSGSPAYTGGDLLRALGGSLRLGGVALVLALAWAALFALGRLALGGRAGAALAGVPALVYGTPTFLLALVVAMETGAVGLDDPRTPLMASLVMSVGPGIFLGVIIHDALRVEMGKPYFTTALAKGLSPARALWRHALVNAAPALLDALPPVATTLLAGSFVAERLFHITYFGYIYLHAAQHMELAVVVVATTFFACLLIAVSMLVEVVRWLVDPRVRTRAAGGGA